MSTIIKVTDVSTSVSVSDSVGGVIRVLRVRPTLGGEIVMYSFLGALNNYPTTRPDGAALQDGDYFMHTGIAPEQLAYYDGGTWLLPHEDAEYSNVARVAAELARDESELARDESVTAKLASELARDESVIAKNESELARDESVTAKDESVTAKNESVTAKLASELARDESVAAKDESVTAKLASELARDESVIAKDESVTAKDESVTAKLASELARDESVIAKNESVTAKNESVTAKDESELARDESVTAKDESVAAKVSSQLARNASVIAKDESVTAKLASELARDESVTAKNESVTAKNESVIAKDESVAAKLASELARDGAVAVASTVYDSTQYNVIDLVTSPSSTYTFTPSDFTHGNPLVLVDRETTFNLPASADAIEPGSEVIIKSVHRANHTIISDVPFEYGSTTYTTNEAGTLVIRVVELGGDLVLVPSFSKEPWGNGSTVIHISGDEYVIQSSDITIGKDLYILADSTGGAYIEVTLPGLPELQQVGFTIHLHVFGGGEAALLSSTLDPNYPNEILSGYTEVGGAGDGTLHATCIGLSQVGTTSVYKANYATSFTDGSESIEPSAPSDGTIYGLKNDKWVPVPSGTGGTVYELTPADLDNETTTPGLVTGEQLSTLGGGVPVGDLTWATRLTYLQGIYPVLPDTISGKTWSHTVASTVEAPGFNVPGVAFEALLPKAGYVEVNLSLTSNGSFFLQASNSLPNMDALGGEPTAEFFLLTITASGINVKTAVSDVLIPGTAGVTSFGIRAMQLSGKPQILINGVAHEIDMPTNPNYLSISTAFVGPVGDTVSVTFDTASKVHEDPGFVSSVFSFDELPALQHHSSYSNSLSYADQYTLASTLNDVPYLISPKQLNFWLGNQRSLTQSDLDNGTSTLGVVSGSQLRTLIQSMIDDHHAPV